MSAAAAPPAVSLSEAARVWARIGFLSFGGPAAQVALMHAELVERRRWIDEARFLHALNYCMLLPGPEAQQLATYIGWLLHGTRGGIVAGVLFVLPGLALLLALSALYVTLGTLPAVAALFFGLKAAVLAVVIEAVRRIGRRALKDRLAVAIAAAAFVALALFAVPFPAVVAGAAIVGAARAGLAPRAPAAESSREGPGSRGSDARAEAPATLLDAMAARGELGHTSASPWRVLRVVGVASVVWAAPVAAVALWQGAASVFVEQGVFFSKAAVVTFGGAYAVLAYVAQRAVETYGWLRSGEMVDGLGLAETTPGPLILVVVFVAFVGASRAPSGLDPLAAGLVGGLLTAWVTFAPSFLWIFAGAPYVEALRRSVVVSSMLSAITAAVVGVVLHMALWFGIHVLFGESRVVDAGPVSVLAPDVATLDVAALAIALVASALLLSRRVGLPLTLAGCAAAGALWHLVRVA